MTLFQHVRPGRLTIAVMFVFALVAMQLGGVKFASAATLTWDGSAGDGLFSTGANWSGNSAPVTGDVITFTPLAGGPDNDAVFLTNDLVGVNFAGIINTLSGSNLTKYFYINTISFADGATITTTGSGAKSGTAYFGVSSDVLTNTSTVSALGSLTTDSNSNLFTGTLNVAGNLTGAGFIGSNTGSIAGNATVTSASLKNTSISGTTTLPAGNRGLAIRGNSATYAGAFVINAGDGLYTNQLAFGNCSVDPQFGGLNSYISVFCQTFAPATYNLSGSITLNSNLQIHVASLSTVNITGTVVANGHTITLEPSSQGTLNVGEGSVVVPEVATVLDGDSPTAVVTVANKETATINGTRGSIFVAAGGILKGTGTMNSLFVNSGGTLAPGNSPGKLTVLNDVSLSGTYQPELLNKDTYDQLAVGENYSGGGNAVNVGGALDTILYNGWVVNQGDQFRIIDNLSSTAVSGTFTGLAEGAQFTETSEGASIVFSISYVGGDGNDVVLTALNTGADPTPPNTGVAQIIMANPVILASLGIITTGILAAAFIRHRRTN